MSADILSRFIIALGLVALGWGGYRLINWLILGRASRKRLGLETFLPGTPAILYFTTPDCLPCKTVQRPALARLKKCVGHHVQVLQVDAVERPDLADYWGVLSVPTTFIIDSQGEPRLVNHGVTSAEKLIEQLEKIEGRKLVVNERRKEGPEVKPVSLGTD
jgi:thioredoxin 1